MDYISLRIDASPCSETITDLIADALCDIGFESFVPDENGLTAFIQKNAYSKEAVDESLADFPIESEFSFSEEFVEGKDWNEEWEKNYFQPIVIEDKCVVHSSFHKDIPAAEFDIVVDPRMAFGTGHHSTTSQMMKYILKIPVEGKTVIDMGTGTGILAMLAKMRGAKDVYGIEIDPDAYANALDNIRLNNCDCRMLLGDAAMLEQTPEADILMANINRNIILADIARYSKSLKSGGTMLLSGFYTEDIPVIEEAATAQGLKKEDYMSDKNWVALRLTKA